MSESLEASPSVSSHRRRSSQDAAEPEPQSPKRFAHHNGNLYSATREHVTAKLHLHRHSTHETASDTSPRRSMEKGYVKRKHRHGKSHNIKDGLREALGEQYQDISATQNAKAHDLALKAGEANGPTGPPREEAVIRAQRPATEHDIEREKWRQKLRDEELLSTMHRLSGHSLSTTRQLDDIYYSILEKLTTLRSTISSMQELAGLTRDLHHDFEAEAKENTQDMQSQIDAFGRFEAQERTVVELEGRIKAGRERAIRVGEQLGQCRETVAWIEKRDKEETAKAGRFYRWMWLVLVSVVAVLCLLKVVYNVKIRTMDNQASALGDGKGSLSHAMRAEFGKLVADDKARHLQGVGVSQVTPLAEDYPRLRIFDEL